MQILLAEEPSLRVRGHATFGLRRRTAGGGGDEAEDFDGFEGGAGGEEAEGVGARVGRGEEEAAVVEEGVGEGEVEGGEAFEGLVVAEGDAEPEAVAAGTGQEGGSTDALGVARVVEVEIPYVSYLLQVLDGEWG